MVGIRDIAHKAGVSVSTVSYALNDSPKVTEETRKRILDIAKDLHYTPNLAGRTLKKQKTFIIGMFIPDFGGDFYSHVLDGVAQTLKQHHYELIVGSGGNRSRSFIAQHLVDGAIILDPTFEDSRITDLVDADNKVVVMDRQLVHPHLGHVLLNNAQGARQAIAALVNSKVDHYVLVTGPGDSHDSQVRVQAALSELEKQTDAAAVVVPSDFTAEGGKKAAKTIADMKMKNVGIFALNDEMAIGLYDQLPHYGYKIGDDVKIVGFDNDDLSGYLRPTLTTIDYSKHCWGEQAAAALIEMIDGSGKAATTWIDTKVIHRASLGEKGVAK